MKNKSLRMPVTCAVLAAMSVVLGKLLAINIGDTLRISFENLPIILASLILGPVWGALCGTVADLVGCFVRGFAVNPLITAAAGLMGVVPWVTAKKVFRSYKMYAVAASVVISHVIVSLGVKTVALHLWYATPYAALFASRGAVYAITAALEAYLCALILKSGAVRKEFRI